MKPRAEYCKNQILIAQMQAMKVHAEIVSGAYKNHEVYHGTNPVPENKFSEAELLEKALQTMGRHIKFMYDCNDELIKLLEE